MLCPELIGREGELARLRSRITRADDGTGGVVALVGEAGAGKSRLVRDALAVDAEVVVLSGRAVPGDSPMPFRPLAEAFLGALRGTPLPDAPSLHGFEAQLGRLVPTWGTNAAADDSPVMVGEAVVRLLTLMASGRGALLVLEDLHWADPETMAVVEYLGDALTAEPVVCLFTSRPEGDAIDLLERLERRQPGTTVRVATLPEDEVRQMVGACLGTEIPPAGVADFVQRHSEGNPFLVEELLAGLVAAGALQEVDGRWEVTGALTPSVPASLRDSIQRRLAAMDPTARRVVGAAALLGRSFSWALLPGIAEVDGRAAIDALRAAVDEQLIDVDGDGFSFRHALTRETVLAQLLPPDRRELAARAWPAIELAHPGLPGTTCELAADLAEAAGDRVAASDRLLESARRALVNGALATAEATARRARQLAEGDRDATLDADEALVHVLVAAGKSSDALRLGRDLAERLAVDAQPARQADLLVELVRAALAAGDLTSASAASEEARAAAGADADPAVLARIDVVAAGVALDGAELERAEDLCRRAVDGARATDQPAVLCEALLILGRVLRPAGNEQALGWFEMAADVASDAGLAQWHLRARQELALERWIDDRDQSPLVETRDLAARYGAHLTVAAMDLGIADLTLSNFDRDRCLRAATDCVEASRRYGLASAPVAHLWLAGAHALAGDDAAMQAEIDAALARDPDDPRILADLYGRVLVTRAFVRDELETLPDLTEAMIEHVHRAPATTSIYPGRLLWALLHTIDGDDLGAAARAEYHETLGRRDLPPFESYGALLDAVAAGRAGDTERATTEAAQAYDEITAHAFGEGMVRSTALVVARAAIRDGWGEPVRWLRESEAWLVERRFDRLARRARSLLADAGAPVPRRGRGDSEVPASLRALGVTSREVDVLKQVVAGRSNKEIAAELHLSPKTVERHLSSLFGRTGVTNRHDLAAVGVAHLA